MGDEAFYVCEACGERVDPQDRDVVAANELIETTTFEGTEQVEGMGVLFHRSHFPRNSRRYRITDERPGPPA